MIRNVSFAAASFALMASPTATLAASTSYNLHLTVPLHCEVQHQQLSFVAPAAGKGISLGRFREYCNAPGGYQLIVSYTPGTLRGARITAGDDQVLLNGSGRAILSQARGPGVRERLIFAVPGRDGFNTDQIKVHILPV